MLQLISVEPATAFGAKGSQKQKVHYWVQRDVGQGRQLCTKMRTLEGSHEDRGKRAPNPFSSEVPEGARILQRGAGRLRRKAHLGGGGAAAWEWMPAGKQA